MKNDPTNILLSELISRKSITPNDSGCQEIISKRLASIGFNCEQMVFGDVTNLWARKGDEKPVLCFAGHTDVVPPGPRVEWKSDPFIPTISKGNLYGRGAADMKSGIAAMVIAVENFFSKHSNYKGSIAFLITSDEEGVAELGTKKVIQTLLTRKETIDYCMIGEPTSSATLADTIRIGRRGSLTGKLTVFGIQGHVAYPQLASNPIRLSSQLISELLSIEWDKADDNFPATNFEIVEIKSSSGTTNVIPGKLQAIFNFRYSPQRNHKDIKKQIKAILKKYKFNYDLEWNLSGEPFLTKKGSLVSVTKQAILENIGIETKLSTAGGTSDGRFIAPLGIEVVELGPVNASIHKINEHVALADPPQLAKIYLRIAELLLVE
ncbi:MAG: succinyl-diaminopimelate desuccinylase [Gammaproteobacteria bacterium]|nr:succinyl-diaminopimelate desuccinylase [Gammaproteobacteria bacterium]